MIRSALLSAAIVVLVALIAALGIGIESGVLILMFSALAWWTWQVPNLALIFFIVSAPLLPLLKFTQSGGSITLIKDVIILTLFARLVCYPLLTKTLPYRRNHLFVPLLLLAGWTVLNLLRADSLVLGILRARDIALYVILYAAVLYAPLDEKYLRRLLGWTVAAGIIVLGLGIYQWFGAVDSAVLRFDPARQVWIPRISSTLAHPSVFGEYLIALAALSAAALATVRTLRDRALWLAFSVTLLPFIFLTYSRGVWIGLAAMVAAMSFLLWRVYSKTRVRISWQGIAGGSTVIAVLVVAIVMTTPLATFIQSAFDPTYASNAIRLDFAVRLIAGLSSTDALIGAGLGDVIAQNFRTIELSSSDITAGAARSIQVAKDATLVDNQFLKTFIELGLGGLLIYTWIYFVTLKSAWNIAQQKKLLPRAVGLAAFGFAAAFIVQALFIDIWDIFPTNALYWIFAGLVAALHTPQVYKNV